MLPKQAIQQSKPSESIISDHQSRTSVTQQTDCLTHWNQQELADAVSKLVQLSTGQPIRPSLIADLKRRFGSEQATMLLDVARLQAKAQKKLGKGLWWVTSRSLQQATAWQVAQYKAKWMGDQAVYDMCCGIGGDAIALCRRGPVVAVDQDRKILSMTAANLAAHHDSTGMAAVICADVTAIQTVSGSLIHIDPDRRTDGTRFTRTDLYRPEWDAVIGLAQRTDGAVVKLAPAARVDPPTCRQTHRTWISLRGSVREQSVLFREANPYEIGTRSAVAISGDGHAKRFAETEGQARPASTSAPREFLIDPDAAIRAAGLTEHFAARHQWSLISGPSGFLTSDERPPEAVTTGLCQVGRILWQGACDDRGLRREMRRRNVYPHAIKVRGTDHDPVKLIKRYRPCGEQPITLWLGRASSRRFAAMTETVSRS